MVSTVLVLEKRREELPMHFSEQSAGEVFHIERRVTVRIS
jgi:hypothetical protein